MKDYAESFYKSKAWMKCRDSYIKHAGGLCEKCKAKGLIVPGVIVHHKCHINPNNIHDPNITLNFDNLELLCRQCHGEEHKRLQRRYKVDAHGHVIIK